MPQDLLWWDLPKPRMTMQVDEAGKQRAGKADALACSTRPGTTAAAAPRPAPGTAGFSPNARSAWARQLSGTLRAAAGSAFCAATSRPRMRPTPL